MDQADNSSPLSSLRQQTDQLAKSTVELNSKLDDLKKKQIELSLSFNINSKEYQNNAKAVKEAETAIININGQLKQHSNIVNLAKGSLQQNQQVLEVLIAKYSEISRSQGDDSKQVKDLNTQIGTLTNTIGKQEEKLESSRKVFDLHKEANNAFANSFDKIKQQTGSFGPSLQEAANGFDAMKTGLSAVKTGFTSVGGAIKTTGFGLLVMVLQSVVEYFTTTTEGARKLKAIISAVGTVVNVFKQGFASLGKIIIDAFTNPLDSIKRLGDMLVNNVINRFKGLLVIWDGVKNMDFKKISNGILQTATGVTNVADKAVKAFNDVNKAANKTDTVNNTIHQKEKKRSDERIKMHKREAEAKKDTPKNDPQTDGTGQSEPLPNPTSGGIQPVSDAIDLREQQTEDAQNKVLLAKTELTQQQLYEIEAAYAKKKADLDDGLAKSKIHAGDKFIDAALKNSKKDSAIYKAAFLAKKATAIADTVISTKRAVIDSLKAYSSIPFIGQALGIVQAAFMGAQGASSIAEIAKQKPGFAKGGHFMSDGRGALLPGYSRNDNTNAYLRSGEAVVVSEAMRKPWARNLVSAINVAHGGRDFSIANPGRGYAVGGIFTDGGNSNRYYSQPLNDQKDLANTLAYQMINNFPPIYVDVKDINTQQNILARTVDRVNL